MDETDETVVVNHPESESGVDFEFVVVPDPGALAMVDLGQRALPLFFANDTLVRAAVINGRREELANPVRVAASERVIWQELVRRSEVSPGGIVVTIPEGKRLTVSLQDEPQEPDRR